MKKRKYRRNLRALEHNVIKTLGQKKIVRRRRIHRREDVFISQ